MDTQNQADIILTHSLEHLNRSLTNHYISIIHQKKKNVDVSTTTPDIKEIVELAISHGFRVNPEAVLSRALHLHGEDFLKLINPSLRGLMVVKFGGIQEYPYSQATRTALECSFNRFWAWINHQNNTELLKCRTLKGVYNTVDGFCTKIQGSKDEIMIVDHYLSSLITSSDKVKISKSQLICMQANSKLRQLHSSVLKSLILDKASTSVMVEMLSERVCLMKLLMEPIGWTEVSIETQDIGCFIGIRGASINQFEDLLKNLLDNKIKTAYPHLVKSEITLTCCCRSSEESSTTSSSSSSSSVMVGAWIFDKDLSTSFQNRSKFTKVIYDELSSLFNHEITRAVMSASVKHQTSSQIDDSNSSSVDVDEENEEQLYEEKYEEQFYGGDHSYDVYGEQPHYYECYSGEQLHDGYQSTFDSYANALALQSYHHSKATTPSSHMSYETNGGDNTSASLPLWSNPSSYPYPYALAGTYPYVPTTHAYPYHETTYHAPTSSAGGLYDQSYPTYHPEVHAFHQAQYPYSNSY